MMTDTLGRESTHSWAGGAGVWRFGAGVVPC